MQSYNDYQCIVFPTPFLFPMRKLSLKVYQLSSDL